jgi:hypothetical protein
MNDQNKQSPENNARSANDKLIHLSDKTTMQTAPDLNSRLSNIESELNHLNARESATNKSFRELLSETRKHSSAQTKELESAREQIEAMSGQYRKMTQDYQRLAASANILNAQLEQARAELSADITNLQLSSQERTDQLADGQLQLIERAKRIEERAARQAEDIDSRVNVINATIASLESRIVAQIREIAEQSEQRDEALTIRTNMLEETFNEQVKELSKADADLKDELNNQVEQLTQANNELSDRTIVLETDSSELKERTEDLQFQSNVIDGRTTDLEDRSDELESLNEKHATALHRVDDTINRHHKGFAVAFIMIASTLAIISYLQQDRWIETTAADKAIQQSISAQQETSHNQSVIQTENSTRISALETQSKADDSKLAVAIEQHEKQLQEIEKNIQSLQNKTENSDQRLNATNPYRRFGKDNTIHPSSWLAAQDKEQFVVEVFNASSKQELYQAAYRFSGLLNENNLSYLEKEISGKTVYTLVYGPFDDQRSAEMASRRLPILNYNSRPVARKLSEAF